MDLFVKCHLKLHIDITLRYIMGGMGKMFFFTFMGSCSTVSKIIGPVKNK